MYYAGGVGIIEAAKLLKFPCLNGLRRIRLELIVIERNSFGLVSAAQERNEFRSTMAFPTHS